MYQNVVMFNKTMILASVTGSKSFTQSAVKYLARFILTLARLKCVDSSGIVSRKFSIEIGSNDESVSSIEAINFDWKLEEG